MFWLRWLGPWCCSMYKNKFSYSRCYTSHWGSICFFGYVTNSINWQIGCHITRHVTCHNSKRLCHHTTSPYCHISIKCHVSMPHQQLATSAGYRSWVTSYVSHLFPTINWGARFHLRIIKSLAGTLSLSLDLIFSASLSCSYPLLYYLLTFSKSWISFLSQSSSLYPDLSLVFSRSPQFLFSPLLLWVLPTCKYMYISVKFV